MGLFLEFTTMIVFSLLKFNGGGLAPLGIGCRGI
jgi:hypothetical protein